MSTRRQDASQPSRVASGFSRPPTTRAYAAAPAAPPPEGNGRAPPPPIHKATEGNGTEQPRPVDVVGQSTPRCRSHTVGTKRSTVGRQFAAFPLVYNSSYGYPLPDAAHSCRSACRAWAPWRAIVRAASISSPGLMPRATVRAGYKLTLAVVL